MTTVMVCFELNGTIIYGYNGSSQVKDVSVAGMGNPALHVTLNELVTTKDGPSFEEKDLQREDLLMIGSPMLLDKEQRLEQRMKRLKEAEDEDNGPFIFEHMKRVRMGDVEETLEDEEDLKEETQKNTLHKECVIEGPLDPNAEVWEEI